MKKLTLALLLSGLSLAANAQTLLYEWNFTNTVTTTLTNSDPSYAYVPGTGTLKMKNGQGTTGIGNNAYFTNGPTIGPGSGAGGSGRGAYVLTGQGYNGGTPTVITLATNLNIGQRIKFTICFWFQLGTGVGNKNGGGGTFPRMLMMGAGTGYDSGSANTGVGIGASVNNWTPATDPTYGNNFAQVIQNGCGNNSGVTSPNIGTRFNLPTETGGNPNGIRASDYSITNDNKWYFEAITFDGTKASGHMQTWLGTSTTNVLLVDSQTAPANMLPQPDFTTNAILFLANRNSGNRPITDGNIADVRIYAGICSSNNLEALRTFSANFVDDGSGASATKPVVQLPPQSGTTHVGLSRSFGVSLTGLQPFAYQWKTNGTSVGGATNATLTLTNVPLTLNGALITCTITNLLGSSNSPAATLTVIKPPTNSYAAAVVALNPYIYWHVNETTNGSANPANPVTIFDYASGLDGLAVDPLNTGFNFNTLAAPLYPGFSTNNLSIQTRANANFNRLNMASLPRYTNDMTICGWIRVTNSPASHAIIYSMNGGNNGPNTFGWGYGLTFGNATTDIHGNPTAELTYNWRVDNFTAATPYSSGLAVPVDEWTFVAVTIDPAGTNATLYMGSHSTGFQTSVDDTNVTLDVISGTTSASAPIVLGRSPYSFYEQGNGSANGGNNIAFNDVAVFYKALSTTTVSNLYVLGAGIPVLTLAGVRDPGVPGNMLLTWTIGTLQEAADVTGPYFDVSGPPTSPFSVPMTDATHFYRLRN